MKTTHRLLQAAIVPCLALEGLLLGTGPSSAGFINYTRNNITITSYGYPSPYYLNLGAISGVPAGLFPNTANPYLTYPYTTGSYYGSNPYTTYPYTTGSYYGTNPYTTGSYYGSNPYTTNPYTTGSYYGSNPYTTNPYTTGSYYGTNPYTTNPYTTGSYYGTNPYTTNPYTTGSYYGSNPYTTYPYTTNSYSTYPYYATNSYTSSAYGTTASAATAASLNQQTAGSALYYALNNVLSQGISQLGTPNATVVSALNAVTTTARLNRMLIALQNGSVTTWAAVAAVQ